MDPGPAAQDARLLRARGMVVAAARPAAEAGRQMLAAGGNAADAAVATAAMLGVVDPQNCGIGGYGGFAVVDDGSGAPPRQVAFNTAVPRAFDPSATSQEHAGSLVTPPAVVAGLARLHAAYGALPWAQCWAPAIVAAREGIAVGRDLATALRWARERHRGLNDAFRATFFARGQAPAEGDPLAQPALAHTLEAVAEHGERALREGALVEQVLAGVRAAGGTLEAADFAALSATLAPAEHVRFGSADVYSAQREQSGGAILLDTLAALDPSTLGGARSERYVRALGAALAQAWARRDAAYVLLAPPGAQTTHLCAADPHGMLVSLTFTHGPTWFGSGLVAPGTGVVLNGGARLLVQRTQDGVRLAQTNLAPTIVHDGRDRYALGTPGARRIPAVVLQLVLDLTHYRRALPDALAAPRMSAAADGTLDAEAPLDTAHAGLAMRRVVARDYYGPAGALHARDGVAAATPDPRFHGACVAHEAL